MTNATYRDLEVLSIGSRLLSSTIGRSVSFGGRSILIVSSEVVHHLRIELFNRLLAGASIAAARPSPAAATGFRTSSGFWLSLGLTELIVRMRPWWSEEM